MKDFLGNEIAVGDSVVTYGFEGFIRGTVLEFKKDKLVVKLGVLESCNIYPDEVIKVDK